MRRPLLLAAALALPAALSAQVPYGRIVHAPRDTADWLTYSGDYAARRYSPLGQISRDNVGRLRVAWAYQVEGDLIEGTPLVVDGIMYLTEPPSTVTALDARTGVRIWSWSPALPDTVRNIGFPQVNRGVAILDSTVVVGTLDAHLVALDAITGSVRWNVRVADNALGYSLTLAPLALDGKVIVGVSGAEAGIRGFIDAYDAASGKRLWRFYTVPDPGTVGSETWGGAGAWRTGGGSTWVTGSYDPELDLLYWGVGNPGPDFDGDTRPGDNLYTCSLLALRPSTGQLAWYFQFTPHDTHDWDATEIPVLFDATVGGRPRKLLAMANRNGFYYLLDRATGAFLAGRAYSKQTWARGLDAKGRPIVIPGMEPSDSGTVVWPSLQGATNWFSPSYSPRTGLFYVAVREMGSIFLRDPVGYTPGQPFMGSGEQAQAGDSASGAVRALDARTGKTVWSFGLLQPPWAGVMATAGGLVFGGTETGEFYALDDRSGKPLWDFNAGAPARSNPMSYAVNGKEYVVMSAGRVVYAFSLGP